jgi:transposase
MIPAQYVKPFVKPNKTDSADAEAICEAAGTCASLRSRASSNKAFSPSTAHEIFLCLVRQRTKLIQALRGYLSSDLPLRRGMER